MPAIDIITHRQQEQTVIHAALPVAGRDLAQPPECRPRLVQPVRQGESIGEVLPRRGKVGPDRQGLPVTRSEEHTSELQSLMRISYAVFCLKKKKPPNSTLSI